jgi:hypothetical protein
LDWKFWIGLLVAVVALWLSVEDRPTVSVGSPIDPDNLLSAQVTLVNDGVLSITDVSFTIFLKNAYVNGLRTWDNVEGDYEPPTKILRPGEPVTTNFGEIINSKSAYLNVGVRKYNKIPYRDLDIALVAQFRPIWAPFWHRTRVFRFKSKLTSQGITLGQVPAENIESDYDEVMSHSFGTSHD